MTFMKNLLAAVAVTAMMVGQVEAASRIKDIADFEGVRENQLIGYGLGGRPPGHGRFAAQHAPFTRQSLTAMLERLGVTTFAISISTPATSRR